MACTLFVIECLDFWRIIGNKIGCGCCETCASKTGCLLRFQQNFFYRAILYILGGVGLLVLFQVTTASAGYTGSGWIYVRLLPYLFLLPAAADAEQ